MRQNFSFNRRPVADLRAGNIRNILIGLRRHEATSRHDLCHYSGLTGAGLSRNIHELLLAGLISEEVETRARGQMGRRRSLLQINPDGAYVICITIAANRKSVAIMNAGCAIIAKQDLTALDISNPVSALGELASATHDLIDKAKVPRHRILGAGVVFGVPDGSISLIAENVTSPVLGWHNAPFTSLLQPKLGMPVRTVSRAQALLQVEIESLSFNYTKQTDTPQTHQSQKCLLINCGVGLGCAFQITDQITGQITDQITGQITGQINCGRMAGVPLVHVSHIAIPGDDVLCHCERRGCLEQIGSGAGVVRRLLDIGADEQLDFNHASKHLDVAIAAAAMGDSAARNAFFNAGKQFARGIDIAGAMLLPDRILIAGEVGRQSNYIDGIYAGLDEVNSSLAKSQLSICDTRSEYASGIFALNEFLFTDELDLIALQLSRKEAS